MWVMVCSERVHRFHQILTGIHDFQCKGKNHWPKRKIIGLRVYNVLGLPSPLTGEIRAFITF